ncbi:protein translocase SEC61 complex subunit gamma [Candidatus Woesearchaeota archaeon]|nr:MAG: protein translocase SEC61 complex subunit gamma [Candidatus Woesearchaeota archaeon]
MKTAMQRLRQFTKECIRVLKVTKKPDAQEYKSIVKVTGLGMLAIGLVAFIIVLFKELLF